MGTGEIDQFLIYLATADKVAASTQNQALGVLLFHYRDVLKREVRELNAVRARRPVRVPTVMTRDDARQLLQGVAARHGKSGDAGAQPSRWESFCKRQGPLPRFFAGQCPSPAVTCVTLNAPNTNPARRSAASLLHYD
jgi:hypothetical protein